MARSTVRRPVLAVAAAVLTALCTAGTAHADLSEPELRSVTDTYLHDLTLDGFVSIRNDRPHADQLIWASDACSWSPDEPLGYEFTRSCYRHDFGYRNYEAQGRLTGSNRQAIDDRFRSDMYSTCAGVAACERVADLYYFAVRQFGDEAAGVPEAMSKARVNAEVAPSGDVTAYTAVTDEGTRVEFPVPR